MPMSVPVVAADGHSYERKAISKWVILKARSPMTGAPLVDMTFFPNVNLEKLIQDFVSKKKVKKRYRVPNVASSSSLVCTCRDLGLACKVPMGTPDGMPTAFTTRKGCRPTL
eukprot:2183539-Prymnesium_polylepis.2